MVSSLFLVTSAICTKFGVFDQSARLSQTIQTVDSIKRLSPNSKIIVLELSAVPVGDEVNRVLCSAVDHVFYFYNSDAVKATSSIDNWDIVKNYNEVACFSKALSIIPSLGYTFEENARIFKVSGRYVLNNNFNPAAHYGTRDIVFGRSKPSQFDPSLTGGIPRQYMSRCWSFPAERLTDIAATFDSMRRAMEVIYLQKHYVDIEHLLYLYMPRYGITELDVVGVEGQLGPNGLQVKD